MFKKPDWVSGLTHAAGSVFAVVGLVFLVRVALQQGTVWHLVSFAIFGGSMVLLYLASSIYHLTPARDKVSQWLRRIDHMMVFVLIAGTYTPFCLVAMRTLAGWILLISVWALSVFGMVTKVFWLQAPRWLYTGFYLVLGWLVVVFAGPLVRSVPAGALLWLGVGGLFYTVGAIFYGTKWPKLVPNIFGFHEVWHLFVLGGTSAHFWAIYRYLPGAG